jgi:plastocyanin
MLLLAAGPVAAGDHDTIEQWQRAADPIVINDASGGAVRDVPPNPNSQTVDVAVGPGFSFTFSPSTVTILVGDTVRWTFASSNHTVTSGPPCGKC